MSRIWNVYSVDPGRPFVAVLAESLLAGGLPAPDGARPDALGLADMLIYLPTRRPARALQQAFMAAAGGAALLLPKIKTIGGNSEELEVLAAAESFLGQAGEMPRAIDELERQLLLTMLVHKWAGATQQGSLEPYLPDEAYGATGARSPAQAVRLARELARLIDALETEGIDFARLISLVDAEHTEQWQRTLDFLNIALTFWPAHLAESGLLSPVAHRRGLLALDARRLRETPPTAPVIVAGLTSADAATVALIEAVLSLPNGALVLPALDRILDEASWAAIGQHPEHPQYGLQRLLTALGLKRDDVRPIGATPAPALRAARWTLVCETMRPAGTTEVWHRFTAGADIPEMRAALRGVSLVEADSAQEEAEVIALILREALERPGETAMLVTPDRALARRAAARLAAWGLDIEDQGGEPFAKTITGTFLELVVAAAQENFSPVPLMILLKHPLCRLRLRAEDLDAGRRALELICFRTPYFGSGLEGLEKALEGEHTATRRPAAARRLGNADWRAARELVRRLAEAFRPLADVADKPQPMPLHELAGAHYRSAQNLAATPVDDDGSALRQGDAGEWAAQLFDSLPGLAGPRLGGPDYPDFYRTLVADKRIRPRRSGHPRIAICDPYEARLQQPDLVILGSLNEASWPTAADPGPWLSRPMRQQLGLPAPEKRIGEAAHDLAAQLGAPRVVLTRAAKVDGAPTVPSRWVLRLQALVKGMGLALVPEQPWLAWARARNAIPSRQRLSAPEPRPPLATRPRQLSVTEIEKWIANPYAIFARHILHLEALDPLGVRPGASLRGQVVHDALGRLTQRFPIELPEDLAAELTRVIEQVLADYTSNPRIAAFWARRLTRFARWFAETEAARRDGMIEAVAEVAGKLVLDAPAGPFTLTARADRIDVADAGLTLTDYKSGQSLDDLARRAADGAAPQLPLEAAIAVAGGFDSIAPAPISALRYISTAGGEPPGKEFPLKGPAADLAVAARHGLERLIAEFDRETTPYRALRRARFRYDYDAYAHLARVAEWSSDDGEED
ncbi:MAG TPA: double-strand break repair protein AddB [Hyphomicrobiaceae bacterium]|nr:double-strand break repair protein AddB [Hyphomicrobiaceae bacterium]